MAGDRLAQFASQSTQCRSFQERLPDGQQALVTVSERRAPRLGDESVAFAVRADPTDGPTVDYEVVVVRLGDALVLTETSRVEGEPKLSMEPARFEALTRQAFQKAQAKLPASR